MLTLIAALLLSQNVTAEQQQADRAAMRAKNEAQRQEYEASQAEEEAKEEALKKKCGRYYHKVSVGMSFKRVAECSGEFSLKYSDGKAKVYQAEGGAVRVENGKVTRVFYR